MHLSRKVVGSIAAATLCFSGLAGINQAQAAPSAPAPTIVGAACAPNTGVTVAVDFTPIKNEVDVACAKGAKGSIAEAFTAAGFTLNSSSFVTTINGVTADVQNASWMDLTSTTNGKTSGSPSSTWVAGAETISDGPVSTGQTYIFSFAPFTGNSKDWTPKLDKNWAFETSMVPSLATILATQTQTVSPAPAAPAPTTPTPTQVATPAAPQESSKTVAAQQAAATWLGNQLAANNNVLPRDGQTDWGLTEDALIGLASSGVGGNQIAATGKALAASGEAYIGTKADSAAHATQISKTMLALTAARLDPQHFATPEGNRNLLADLENTMEANGSYGSTPSAFNQALAISAERSQLTQVPSKAVDWLMSQQCSNDHDKAHGSFGWTAGCSNPDQDTTAMVIQALLANKTSPTKSKELASAIAWLRNQQNSSGGFPSAFGGPNANTTGVAAEALNATSDNSAQAKAASFLTSLQIDCPTVIANGSLKKSDIGAIAMDADGLDAAKNYGVDDTNIDQLRRSTVQAILGLGAPLYPFISSNQFKTQPDLPVTNCSVPVTGSSSGTAGTSTMSTPSAASVKGALAKTGGNAGNSAGWALLATLIILSGLGIIVRGRYLQKGHNK